MTIWARGAGRGARCGARGPRGCSEHSAVGAHGPGAFWAGVRGSCAPQVCVRLRGIRVPGLDAPGRALRTSRAGPAFFPAHGGSARVLPCVPPVTPNQDMGYVGILLPCELLVGLSLVAPLCQVDLGWVALP